MKVIREAFVLVSVAAAAGCGGEPGVLPVSTAPIDVTVSRAVLTSGIATAPGTIAATKKAELATRISGTITRVAVDIGSRVSIGDTLVTLDTAETSARIASAEAAADLARQWHDRIAALARDGAASAQELDDARARLDMAEAALRDVRAQRNYVFLRAPFSGVITARSADPGDLARPGVPLLELLGTGSLKIEADLPGELATRLSAGDRIWVVVPETGERHRARITRLAPAVERETRRSRVEARFEAGAEPRIDPGTFVRLELDQPASVTRWIPADAVVRRGQLYGVFVVDGDVLRLRWVRLGKRLSGTVELLAGPAADALLVRNPAAAWTDGQALGRVQQVHWRPPFIAESVTPMEGSR